MSVSSIRSYDIVDCPYREYGDSTFACRVFVPAFSPATPITISRTIEIAAIPKAKTDLLAPIETSSMLAMAISPFLLFDALNVA